MLAVLSSRLPFACASWVVGPGSHPRFGCPVSCTTSAAHASGRHVHSAAVQPLLNL